MYSTTFKEARDALSDLLQEPVRLYFQDTLTTTMASPASKDRVYCSTLIPFFHDFAYRGSFLYIPSIKEERIILRADDQTGEIIVAKPFSTQIPLGTPFEIHAVSVTQKLNALNSAIRQAYPYIYATESVDIVIPKYQNTLTLSGFLPSTWERVYQAWTEPYTRSLHGFFITSSATTTTLTVSGTNWDTDYYAGWEVGFITGDLRGKIYTVQSNTGDTITLQSPLPQAPASGDEFVLKGPLESDVSLQSVWRECPWITPDIHNDIVYLPLRLTSDYGRTLRLYGMKRPTPFTLDDASTTEVPVDYLAYQAANIINIRYVARSSDITTDVFQWIGRWDAQEAERILFRLAMPQPPMTMFRGHTKGIPHRTPTPFSD